MAKGGAILDDRTVAAACQLMLESSARLDDALVVVVELAVKAAAPRPAKALGAIAAQGVVQLFGQPAANLDGVVVGREFVCVGLALGVLCRLAVWSGHRQQIINHNVVTARAAAAGVAW